MCLAQAGLQNLKDEVREQALKCYIKTEDKLKFRNKAYLYLMKVGGGDPAKMIASERTKTAKRKAAAMRQRYTRNDPVGKASTLVSGGAEWDVRQDELKLNYQSSSKDFSRGPNMRDGRLDTQAGSEYSSVIEL